MFVASLSYDIFKISLLTLKIKHSWYFILQSARIHSKLKVSLDFNPRQIDVDEWTTQESHTQLVLYLNPYDFRYTLPIYFNLSHHPLKPEWFVVFTVAVSFMTYSRLLYWLLVSCFGKQPKIILLIWKQFVDLLQKSAGIRSLDIQA